MVKGVFEEFIDLGVGGHATLSESLNDAVKTYLQRAGWRS
jgi:hypothetical protein